MLKLVDLFFFTFLSVGRRDGGELPVGEEQQAVEASGAPGADLPHRALHPPRQGHGAQRRGRHTQARPPDDPILPGYPILYWQTALAMPAHRKPRQLFLIILNSHNGVGESAYTAVNIKSVRYVNQLPLHIGSTKFDNRVYAAGQCIGELNFVVAQSSVADPGCLSWIPILTLIYLGSRISNPGSQIQQQEGKRRGKNILSYLFL
jgi:hypothetical protein